MCVCSVCATSLHHILTIFLILPFKQYPLFAHLLLMELGILANSFMSLSNDYYASTTRQNVHAGRCCGNDKRL